jgi:tripartite-type tricarboxylate transporter receptor subunit TctC
VADFREFSALAGKDGVVNASMKLPEVRGNLDKQSILTTQMTPEEFTAFVQSEVDKWTPVVKGLGQVK